MTYLVSNTAQTLTSVLNTVRNEIKPTQLQTNLNLSNVLDTYYLAQGAPTTGTDAYYSVSPFLMTANAAIKIKGPPPTVYNSLDLVVVDPKKLSLVCLQNALALYSVTTDVPAFAAGLFLTYQVTGGNSTGTVYDLIPVLSNNCTVTIVANMPAALLSGNTTTGTQWFIGINGFNTLSTSTYADSLMGFIFDLNSLAITTTANTNALASTPVIVPTADLTNMDGLNVTYVITLTNNLTTASGQYINLTLSFTLSDVLYTYTTGNILVNTMPTNPSILIRNPNTTSTDAITVNSINVVSDKTFV